MTLPHDAIAEANVLGACLIDCEAVKKVCEELTEDDFFRVEHKKIFSIISELNAKDEHVDAVSVGEIYKDYDITTNLATRIVTNANLINHIKIVKARSIRRRTIEQAMRVIDVSENGNFNNITEYMNECKKLMDIDYQEKSDFSTKICDVATDYLNYIENARKQGEQVMKKTGVQWIDREMGGIRKELTFLAAKTSVGKTACAINIAKNCADQGLKVAFFSIEMSNFGLMERFMTMITKICKDKLRKPWELNDDEVTKVCKASSYLMGKNLHLYEKVWDIESIRQECRRLKDNGGLDIVFIDHLHILKTLQKIENDVKRIEHLTRELVLMKKEFDCSIWCLAQFNREASRDNEQPKMHQLKGGSSIEQDADNVILLHDPSYGEYEQERTFGAKEIQIIMAKQREGERDVMGYAKFYKRTQLFI